MNPVFSYENMPGKSLQKKFKCQKKCVLFLANGSVIRLVDYTFDSVKVVTQTLTFIE